MKKAFLMVEVIISILLLSGIILTLFKINDNSFKLINKVDTDGFYNQLISIVALNYNTYTKSNISVYPNTLVTFNDETRKEIKSIKIQMKQEIDAKKRLSISEVNIPVTIYKTTYNIEKKNSKKIYSIQFK